MKQCGAMAVALMAFWVGASIAPAYAAPPTVTPSPGYDARLQEQRAAAQARQPLMPGQAQRHRARRLHRDRH